MESGLIDQLNELTKWALEHHLYEFAEGITRGTKFVEYTLNEQDAVKASE